MVMRLNLSVSKTVSIFKFSDLINVKSSYIKIDYNTFYHNNLQTSNLLLNYMWKGMRRSKDQELEAFPLRFHLSKNKTTQNVIQIWYLGSIPVKAGPTIRVVLSLHQTLGN